LIIIINSGIKIVGANMDIDYVVDKKGNKYKIKTSVDGGLVVTTSILPELRPIDSMCIAKDGLIFSKWRDPEYRNSEVIDGNRVVAFVEMLKHGILSVDRIYGYVHPSNHASIKWVLSRGGYMDGKVGIDGVVYDKYVVPLESLVKMAGEIKEKCLEMNLTKS
jgi:hypothetical protein